MIANWLILELGVGVWIVILMAIIPKNNLLSISARVARCHFAHICAMISIEKLNWGKNYHNLNDILFKLCFYCFQFE